MATGPVRGQGIASGGGFLLVPGERPRILRDVAMRFWRSSGLVLDRNFDHLGETLTQIVAGLLPIEAASPYPAMRRSGWALHLPTRRTMNAVDLSLVCPGWSIRGQWR